MCVLEGTHALFLFNRFNGHTFQLFSKVRREKGVKIFVVAEVSSTYPFLGVVSEGLLEPNPDLSARDNALHIFIASKR